jgi:YD repeat-containing protein
VTETDSENYGYADGAGATETDTCSDSDPGSGYDNFSFNIIMSYNPSGFSGMYQTNDGGGGEDDYSGSGTDGENYSSSTNTDGITVPWQETCDTSSNASYNEGGIINPAGDTGAFQASEGCTETLTLSDSVNFTGLDQANNDTQTDTSKYKETDHETQPETYTESCVFGPNGCSGTYKSSDPVTWHDTYSGSEQFNDNWQDQCEPFAGISGGPYPTSGSLSEHDRYSGSDDDYPSDSNTGSFTQAGSTGLSDDTEKWDGTETYNDGSSENYATAPGTTTASANERITDHDTFKYNGDDCDADSYTPTGGGDTQTGYDEVEDTTTKNQTQGENQFSCPADSLSDSFNDTTTDSGDQQWHDSGAIGPTGSTSTTLQSDDSTENVTEDGSDTATYNWWDPTWGGGGTWIAGTPETTTSDVSLSFTFDDPAPVTVTTGTPPATPITMPVAADALSPDRIQTLLASLQTAETTAQQDPSQLAAATGGAIAAFTAVDADANGQNGGAVYAAITGGNTFDSAGRVTSVTNANGGATTFTYDSSGNLTSLTDPDGNTTTWTYNSQDQLIQETNPLGASAYYSYDSAGDLARYTDYDGRVRQFTYDSNHDLLSETWCRHGRRQRQPERPGRIPIRLQLRRPNCVRILRRTGFQPVILLLRRLHLRLARP